MVFSSLFFCFCFLPINLLVYILMPDIRLKNRVMLVFSLIFYAWAGPLYLFLLLGMTIADYFAAKYIDSCFDKKQRKLGLIAGCTVNLLLLGIFKYLTFILENLNALTGFPAEVAQIALPIGISFYTFQLISYMVDVYRGEVEAQQHFPTLLLYVSLYHQCIAGPIIRYKTVEAELTSRRVTYTDVFCGIRRFAIGLAKKVLLANQCGALADSLLSATDNAAGAAQIASQPAIAIIVGTICFTLQIYLDFSAYSDMAIGMGRMLGFHYLENFNYPYMADSVTDFWRRWHISLSSFFRDYVYIPLGGNRNGMRRQIINLLIVWALTGFWHGASWNYLLWGLYYFLFLCLEKFILKDIRIPKVVYRIAVLLVINFGWMLFRCENLGWLGLEIKGIFGLNGNGFSNYETAVLLKSNIVFLIVAVIACTPLVKTIGMRLSRMCTGNKVTDIIFNVIVVVIPVVLIVLSAAGLVGDSYNPFLYFRF